MRDNGVRFATVLLGASLVLTACLTENRDGSGGGGESVPAGATQQQYAAAFEDVEPIELTMQSPTAPGTSASAAIEAYADALDEWSGGKVTVEIAYANSIAPPDQVVQALADGRLDVDYVYPMYDPARFPANHALYQITTRGGHDPVAGYFQAFAGYFEAGMATKEVSSEMESEGVHLIMPYAPRTSLGVLCTTPRVTLEDLNGARIRIASQAQAKEVEALGATPVSMSYAETYTALQRGTIDCQLASGWDALAIGTLPLAPNLTIDPEVGFNRASYGIGVSLKRWEELPLAAKQLLHDRLDVYAEHVITDLMWDDTVAAWKILTDERGKLSEFGDDVRARLDEANAGLENEVRASDALDGDALLRDADAALKKWRGIVVDELGYPELGHDEFVAWYSKGVDLEPFIDRLREEILLPHRPR